MAMLPFLSEVMPSPCTSQVLMQIGCVIAELLHSPWLESDADMLVFAASVAVGHFQPIVREVPSSTT